MLKFCYRLSYLSVFPVYFPILDKNTIGPKTTNRVFWSNFHALTYLQQATNSLISQLCLEVCNLHGNELWLSYTFTIDVTLDIAAEGTTFNGLLSRLQPENFPQQAYKLPISLNSSVIIWHNEATLKIVLILLVPSCVAQCTNLDTTHVCK